jgi:hypothetical protein
MAAAAYALTVEEYRDSGMGVGEAIDRTNEMLLSPQDQRAAANRRAFQHLLAPVTRRKDSGGA